MVVSRTTIALLRQQQLTVTTVSQTLTSVLATTVSSVSTTVPVTIGRRLLLVLMAVTAQVTVSAWVEKLTKTSSALGMIDTSVVCPEQPLAVLPNSTLVPMVVLIRVVATSLKTQPGTSRLVGRRVVVVRRNPNVIAPTEATVRLSL